MRVLNLFSKSIRFGLNLRRIRKKWGISQSQFAKLCDLTHTAIANYERSKAIPRLELLVFVHKMSGISLDKLILSDLTEDDISQKPLFIPRIVVDFEEIPSIEKPQEIIEKKEKEVKSTIPILNFDEIRELIHQDKIEDALKCFSKIKDSKISKSISLLKGRISSLKEEKIRGILSNSEIDLKRAKLRNDILEFSEGLCE